LLDLTALGIGAIIGTGIFVIIGEAIGVSGPSLILSFVLAGITCIFSALAYAELASTIPVAGSAYTYGYATLGELVAWIIGWDLILEYGVSVAAVAIGWSQYLNSLLDTLFGVTLPAGITAAEPSIFNGEINLMAALIVLAVTAVLVIGVRESARTNTVMVFVKLAVLALFIALGLTAFNADNMTPFFREGLTGVASAASLIFFAYIGFDAISTSGEETKNPGRDLPIAIIGSLLIATVIYILVAIVATGALPFERLDGVEAPLATVMSEGAGYEWAANIISIGALVAITSVCLTVMYGQTRIMFAMSRDGLVPRSFGRVSPKTGTPVRITLVFGLFIAALAALVPLDIIFKLVNIGTLFAFIIVNLGVIVLRRTRPDLKRGFRVPFVPVFPIIGALLCLYLIAELDDPLGTYIRFAIWLAIGLAIYFLYGKRHSLLQQGHVVNPDAEFDNIDGGHPAETR
jgi:APA family basic amino acid/polyamine antiporter